jgi:hypothetical protein
VREGDLLGKATPHAYAGGVVTLSSPPAAATDSRSVCGPPVGSQAFKLALGFALTRYSRWCAGITLSPIGVLVEPFRFDLSYRLSFFVLMVCVSFVSV